MRLEPKAKPVRIRIKSGGEEHFNLESLRRNFSVQDLWEAVRGKSLSRWLQRQEEKEMSAAVDDFCKIEKPSVEDYVRFSTLFFANESIVDVDSLLKFYKSKGLEKNVKNAFLELFDSLSFETGRQWFESFRHLKKAEEWIDYFEHRIDGLDNKEAVKCHELLLSLYRERGETREMTYHQKELAKLLGDLAKTDENLLERLLESGDYQSVKSIYDNPETQNKVDKNKWIEVFRTRKDSLSDQDKGECLYILYTLYESVQNKGMAKMALKLSAGLGCQQAKKKLPPTTPRYPKIMEMSKRANDGTINSIGAELFQLSKSAENTQEKAHYLTCYHCIQLFIHTRYNYYNTQPVKEDRNEIGRNNKDEKPLVFLVAGLAWEAETWRDNNKEMYKEIGNYVLPDDFRKIFEAKKANKELVVTAECGLSCNVLKDPIIDQMFFFMETYGERYSFE